MTPRRRIAPRPSSGSSIGAAYFLIPLVATLILSIRSDQTGKCCTLGNYSYILDDPRVLADDQAELHRRPRDDRATLVLLVPTVTGCT